LDPFIQAIQVGFMDPITSYSHLHDELWGLIISNIQNANDFFALQRTSKQLNACTRQFMTEMTEEVAKRRAFFTPSLYLAFNDRLKNSRVVLINALTQDPALFESPGFPHCFRADTEIKKIVFVAAKLLSHERQHQLLLQQEKENPSFLKIDKELKQLSMINIPPKESELWSLPPFLLHGPFYLAIHYQKASSAIRADYDISLTLLKKGWPIYEHLDPILKQDRSIAHEAISGNGRVLEIIYPPFQDDVDLVRLACREDTRNLRFATERVQRLLHSEGIKPENTPRRYSMTELRRMATKQ